MRPPIHKSTEQIAIDRLRAGGGAYTVDYRVDDPPKTLVKTMNRMAERGSLTKSVSPCGLIHTFKLK